MERMIVVELHREQKISRDHAERWRDEAERHLDRETGRDGMDAAADAAGAAGDENRVPRIASEHDHFVAAEERSHRVAGQDALLFQVGDRVESERARDAGDRIKIDIFDIAVLGQERVNLRFGERLRPGILRRAASEAESARRVVAQRHPSLGIDIDR